MKTLIVFDSVFGNTEKVARAIGGAIGSSRDVGVTRVGDAKPEGLAGLELLIVGSPTRAFRPAEGIKNFLKKIPAGALKGIKVAAFDTRVAPEDIGSSMLRFMTSHFGYASKPITEGLKKKGGDSILPPEGFFVKDREGPLKEGELERAAGWAKRIDETRRASR